jgi:MFS transporter, DHA2 family, multidrug resistance protein
MSEKSDRFIITVAMMSATVMQALDTTIVNVALPHMAGNLGASMDQVSWVLTSYLIAASLVMPLTGYLSDRFGRRRFLLVSIGGFVIASGLCGLSQNLAEMVAFRLLQGLFGASLIPLSQAVMAETFPPHERGKAMAIWGMGVMVAPILGPTLGGWLTEVVSWRWAFYLNLPVGALSFFLAATYVPDTEKRARNLDWIGFASLALSLCALQVTLDRGEQDDWFGSRFIASMAAASAALFVLFAWRTLTNRRDPLFDFAVLKDRNFVLACTIMFAMGIGLFGGMLLQPMFLENLLSYPATEAGWDLVPRGVATLAAMIVVSRLASRVAPKTLLLFGVAFSIAGSVLMTRLTADISGGWMILPLALQGFGLGLIFVPASTIAFATIPKMLSAEAAGLYSLVRSVGSAVGISLVSSYFVRSTQAHWELFRGQFSPYRSQVTDYLAGMHLAPSSPMGAQMLAKALTSQAQLAAYVDTFWLVAASFVVMLPVLLFMRKTKPGGPAPAAIE